MELKGEFIVGSNKDFTSLNYEVLDKVTKFSGKSKCIILENLSPDYYLLFGSIKLIISERGSELSHLAILARENNIPIFIVKGIISKIKKKGKITIKNNIVWIEDD